MKKIAVPVRDGNQIDEHFGHCEGYSVYTISDTNKIEKVEPLASPQGCGCKSNIAFIMAEMGITTMLAGGMGEGAVNVLGNCGINVIRGCAGNADDVVKNFIDGKLVDAGNTCPHHGHDCHH